MNRIGIALGIVVVVIIAAAYFYIHPSRSNQPSSYAASVTADSVSIAVTDNDTPLKTITLGEIPSFDGSSNADYLFDPTVAVDSSQSMLYFSVYNVSTAGNANADRALFSYNISTGKFSLLKSENYTVSFDTLEPSSDGQFLVYSEGVDGGGVCDETLGLEVYDLQNQTDTDSIFLPANVIGVIEFDHWVSDTTFAYQEETYSSPAACEQDLETSPQVVEKSYTMT